MAAKKTDSPKKKTAKKTAKKKTAKTRTSGTSRPRPKIEPEKDIQRRILDWLETTNLVHWRQNSGWAFMGTRMVRLGPEGLPDVIVIVPPTGQFLGLEVKSARGKLRPSQIEFAKKVTNAGAVYRIVRSLEQAQNAVAEAMGHGKLATD